MSIIGTRPPLISETNLYELHHKVQNDMILEMRIACGLEVKDYE